MAQETEFGGGSADRVDTTLGLEVRTSREVYATDAADPLSGITIITEAA